MGEQELGASAGACAVTLAFFCLLHLSLPLETEMHTLSLTQFKLIPSIHSVLTERTPSLIAQPSLVELF